MKKQASNPNSGRSLPDSSLVNDPLPQSSSEEGFFTALLDTSEKLLDALACEDWARTERLAARRSAMFKTWQHEAAARRAPVPTPHIQQQILSIDNALNTAVRIRHESMGSRLAVMSRGARATGAYAQNARC